MFNVDKQSRTPIYEQLITSVEESILHGFLPLETKIPSVRELSTRIGVNPNTIQKAYADLEARGITHSVPGIGRFISKDAEIILKGSVEKHFEQLAEVIAHLKLMGLSSSEILSATENICKGE
ncbi:MAG: GntR family transcriptional regulator [Bacillota bacterium]